MDIAVGRLENSLPIFLCIFVEITGMSKILQFFCPDALIFLS